MAKLEKQLNPRYFLRISRSAIVSVRSVDGIEKGGRYDSWVRLESGDRVGASRNLDELESRVRELS